jgi:hypothetical protein
MNYWRTICRIWRVFLVKMTERFVTLLGRKKSIYLGFLPHALEEVFMSCCRFPFVHIKGSSSLSNLVKLLHPWRIGD